MPEVEESPENYATCLHEQCGRCPSYPEGDHGEALYCAKGTSDQRIERVECRCPDCPIWARYGLGRQYYCD